MLIDIFNGHATPGEYVFVLLCIAAAWMIGKSVANDWEGLPQIIIYSLLLGCGARFLHFALYEAHFLSLDRYLVDTAILLVAAYFGFRYTRTGQMTRQYHWLYEKTSPFSWKAKS